jgi:peptide/nickel transport system permease protein
LILVSLLVFGVMRILPGDPAINILVGITGEGTYTQEQLEEVRRRLGTDKPLYEQYGRWIGDAVRLEFGYSYRSNTSVTEELKRRLPVTLQLTAMALLMAVMVALPLGVVSAVYQDRWPDYAAKVFTVVGISLPTFWAGILIVFFLAQLFNWGPPLGYAKLWNDPLKNLEQMIFPALSLGYLNMAFTARVTRSAMLEVLREDYIRTARAKGLAESVVLVRHALRNAFLPVITVAGYQFGILLGGSVVTEGIFLVPGVGQALVLALTTRDFNIIQAIVLIVGVFIVALNLAIDILYGLINPRVRYT